MDYEKLYKQMISSTENEIKYTLHMFKEYDHCCKVSNNASYLGTRNKWLYKLVALKSLYQAVYFQMPKSLRDSLVDRGLLKEVIELVGR